MQRVALAVVEVATEGSPHCEEVDQRTIGEITDPPVVEPRLEIKLVEQGHSLDMPGIGADASPHAFDALSVSFDQLREFVASIDEHAAYALACVARPRGCNNSRNFGSREIRSRNAGVGEAADHKGPRQCAHAR